MRRSRGSKPPRDGGVLEQLTLSELVELWAEREIEKRLREVEFFHEEINTGAHGLEHIQVLPLLGGFCEGPRHVEVLVEVRDQIQRMSKIGAWKQDKRGDRDAAFRAAYDKAKAHAIIQLLPANVWRPWIGADQYVTAR
ncbi:MAG: hypothetical protein GKS06_18700 [Acidobacteria bacterium]|nr:hypothetical protein [Acidobacteriota bacterium]